MDWGGRGGRGERRPCLATPRWEVLGRREGEGKGAAFSASHSQYIFWALDMSVTETPQGHWEEEAGLLSQSM